MYVLEMQKWAWYCCGLVGYRMPCLHMALEAGLEAGPGTPATEENEDWITEFNQYFNSFFQAASRVLMFSDTLLALSWSFVSVLFTVTEILERKKKTPHFF